MLRLGSQIPACGSREPSHRALACQDCQDRYRDRRRKKAQAFRRRRYRYKNRRRSPAPKPARCGSVSPVHYTHECRACRRIANAEDYRKHGVRRAIARRARPPEVAAQMDGQQKMKARIRARARRAGAAKICRECGTDRRVRLIAVDDEFYAFGCNRHRRDLAKNLTLAQAEKQQRDVTRERLEAARQPRAEPEEWLNAQPAAVSQRIRAAAQRSPFGGLLDERSPLYRMQLRAIVAKLQAEERSKPV